MKKRYVKVGMLGCGTVGSAVLKVLERNRAEIEQRIRTRLEVKRILVRDVKKKRTCVHDPALLTTNPEDILGDDEIDIVVEVIGGTEPARDYLVEAMRRGKSVVTANKEVMARHGQEVFETAARFGVGVGFEASVGGGIPIIKTLKQALAANRVETIMGIINGTTNYILTRMSHEGKTFEESLQEAQEQGYAESDPAADIDGHDAARKLAILASIAFGVRIKDEDVYREGLRRVSVEDIEYGRELGWELKLLAIGKRNQDDIEIRVHPTFIPTWHPLASIRNEFNAVFVRGDALGDSMYYGRGAGGEPTASAVIADIIDIVHDPNGGGGLMGCTCFAHTPIRPFENVECEYYLRLEALDRPGVLARIAKVFGDNEISLNSVIQKKSLGETAEIVLVTHLTREGNLQKAVELTRGLDCVAAVHNVIRIEGGHYM